MFYTVYASCANHLFTREDLVALLKKSRTNNELLEITGILIYNRGTFIQMLEGDEHIVRDLYKTINADPRHKLIFTLAEGHREDRQFPAWSMAFKDLDDESLRDLPGFSSFINKPLDSEDYYRDPMAAMELLYLFREVVT